MTLHLLEKADIFLLQVDAIVNPVNCYGVSGAGLAKAFKERYPANQKHYEAACKNGTLKPGVVLSYKTERDFPRFIINFPTKRHWTNKSQIVDIKDGLDALVNSVRTLELKSIGLPALGCGLGGLQWSEVLVLIEDFSAKVDIPVFVTQPL